MALQELIAPPRRPSAEPDGHCHLDRLRNAIEHAAHLLPAQGPITVFIHHNTLHAYEHLPFFEGVRAGARQFGCEPFLSEDRYREELRKGRIRFADLEMVLREELGERAEEPVFGSCMRLELQLAMLQYPQRHGPTEELRWFVAETDALRRVRPEASAAVRARLIAETRRWALRDLRGGDEVNVGTDHREAMGLNGLLDRLARESVEDWSESEWEAFTLQSLWRVCCAGATRVPERVSTDNLPIRHHDLLQRVTGENADELVNELLIRFCAAFLDQGFANWPMPHRECGFFAAFSALYGQSVAPPNRWLRGLPAELARLRNLGTDPLHCIAESLQLLGIAEDEWDEFVAATLLALPGWAGMVRQVEERGDRVPHPIPPGSLIEFLAVRLLLDRFALTWLARESINYNGPLNRLREELRSRCEPARLPSVEQRAFAVFQLAQVLDWCPSELAQLSTEQWQTLLAEIESFSALERRQRFHLAYERRFREQSLNAVGLHQPSSVPRARPRFQLICCLDEREESFRRHVEEVAVDCETFGAAGFYGVAMYYRGAADAHFVPLCPIIVTPRHWVTEQVDNRHQDTHQRRARARRALGNAYHHFHVGSRTFALGAMLSAGVGVLATIPLVARILFPRLTARVQHLFGKALAPPPDTRLQLERQESEPGPEHGHLGYDLDEMAAIAEQQLRDIGLTRRFARLVFILGHGSSSLNNPHKSAYDCGACGGSSGAPNARALAQMLNNPRVRQRLAQRGLAIPADTHFVGGYHNTCDDSVTLIDLDRVPPSHLADLAAAQNDLETACDRNSHERCRRFLSAPLTMTFEAARRHVESRSVDLAQTRPELGHATNALCVVARRERTRGLFLDRRSFLTSYDPTQDDADATILARLLQAAVPVCAGINLEYYFSRVDNQRFGCGTKLPHNIAAQLGVMDGAASDLRTGLPWQMVELHEPVRLLFIIETTQEKMRQIMERQEGIGRLIRNGWVQLALLDPNSSRLDLYHPSGEFHEYRPTAPCLPRAVSSADWYRGWRDHLEFAEIGN